MLDEYWSGYAYGFNPSYSSSSSNKFFSSKEADMEDKSLKRKLQFLISGSKEQLDTLSNRLDDDADDLRSTEREAEFFDGSYERISEGLMEIYSGDHANFRRLGDIICKWQNDCNYEELVYFEFAEFHTRNAQPDGFGGGAVVCYKGNKEVMTTGDWAMKRMTELVGA